MSGMIRGFTELEQCPCCGVRYPEGYGEKHRCEGNKDSLKDVEGEGIKEGEEKE